jgi:hypothetical protein
MNDPEFALKVHNYCNSFSVKLCVFSVALCVTNN